MKKSPTQPTQESRSPLEHPPAFFALISDIHANIDALEAVIADIQTLPCRAILCLGDVVGYGPEPAECVQVVMDTCAVTVMGNHEAMLLSFDKIPTEDWRPTIRDPLILAQKQLSSNQLDWINRLPLSADIDPITLVHASLNEPEEFFYIKESDTAEMHFAAQTSFISFHGHTHVPVTWEQKAGKVVAYEPMEKTLKLDANNRYAVNVGSVGQPRDDDPRASYALYDYQNRILIHRRVKYNLSKAIARFQKAGLPSHNGTRLRLGY